MKRSSVGTQRRVRVWVVGAWWISVSIASMTKRRVRWSKDAQKKHRGHIIENNDARATDFMARRPLEAGTRVRLKLAKSKLDKASAPSWSAAIYTIKRW